MTVPEREWERAVALLSAADQVALACHVDPDGDALGSMLALQRHMTLRGVATVVGWGTADGQAREGPPVPWPYGFLPGLQAVVPADRYPSRPQLMVALDTGSPERLGTLRASAEAAETLVVIDHHAVGEAFGDVRLVDGASAATAVLVAELVDRMDGAFDRDLATCLYVALVTDTGRFQHASTTPDVLRLAARLMECGVDAAGISRRIWETHSFGYAKVLGRTLDRAVLIPDVRLVWTAVRQEDLDEFGVGSDETEGIIDVLRRIKAAETTMVCKQHSGGWKTSLRSRGRVNVGELASQLGGGGHPFAAGFTADGPLDEVVARVIELLRSLDGGGR